MDYRQRAQERAEKLGITSYRLSGSRMIYMVYFGVEGFYRVSHDLKTGAENRKHQKTTTQPYNYFVG